jgi:predicted protein tyrosine phosphatase
MNWLFVSTSDRDVAKTLAEYFTQNYGLQQYDSAGISPHLCSLREGQMVSDRQMKWADVICCVADIHYKRLSEMYGFAPGDRDTKGILRDKKVFILNIPVYHHVTYIDDYLIMVDDALRNFVNKEIPISDIKLITKNANPYRFRELK